ncbi:MAG: efflux RND transporter periplasmic adaptor subunit [Pseudomonadota bacterium]
MDTSSSKDLDMDGARKSLVTAGGGALPGEGAKRTRQKSSTMARAAFWTFRSVMQLSVMAVVLVAATFMMFQLEASREERPKRERKEVVYTIDTVTAAAQTNQPVISVFGDVMAGRRLNLTALVAGEVVEVNPALRIGARLSKGDVLLKINRFSFEVARDEAVANLAEARATLAEAKVRLSQEETALKRAEEQLVWGEVDLARARDLLESGTVTQRLVEERQLVVSQRKSTVDTSSANIDVQRAQVAAREATVDRWAVQVRNAEQSLENTVLRAPFDVVIQEVNVEVGQTVSNNQSLVTLFEADTLDARFVLSDGQYGRLISGGDTLIGRAVQVDWTVGDAKQSYEAVIDRVGAQIAANRGGVELFARLSDGSVAGGIRPGAFVTVRVPDKVFQNTYELPDTALFPDNTVYVVGDDSRLKSRKVDIAVYDRDTVIVRDGLLDGDLVLTTQIAEVGDGLLVRLEDSSPSNAEPATGSSNQGRETETSGLSSADTPAADGARPSGEASDAQSAGPTGPRG